MRYRLGPVITGEDFSAAERSALLLDGEVFAVGEWIAPIDQVPGMRLRAGALRASIPSRLIAERMTAAWVWGALSRAPNRHQLCAAIGSRSRPSNFREFVIREVVLAESDVLRLDGLAITSPVRTAVDIARTSGQNSDVHTGATNAREPEDTYAIGEIMHLTRTSLGDCLERMDRMGRTHRLPNRIAAEAILRRAAAMVRSAQLTRC